MNNANNPSTPLSPALPLGHIPRWEHAHLAQEIFLLANLMQRAADRLVEHRNLTAARWLLIGALEHFQTPPTLTDLAKDGLMTVQNVSRLAASMEADGLVERFTVQGKGRHVFVRLTEHGEAVRDDAKQEAQRFADAFLRGFSAREIDATRAALDRLIRNTQRLEHALEHADADHHETNAPDTRNGTNRR